MMTRPQKQNDITLNKPRNLNQPGQPDMMHIKAFQISMHSQTPTQAFDWVSFKNGFAWRT